MRWTAFVSVIVIAAIGAALVSHTGFCARIRGRTALQQSPGGQDAAGSPGIDEFVPPIEGLKPAEIMDTFNQARPGGRRHEATDLLAPRGTPVHAVTSGVIQKLFLSKPGGNTIYEFDMDGVYCYYYAHLEGYAPGLHEGQRVAVGEVIGYVGTTGNADPSTPHLHFAIFRLGPEKRWWEGTPVDPYPILIRRAEQECR